MKEDNLERMKAFYERGDVPWDQELPPPEVVEFVKNNQAGRAVDLGCGLGRASLYLAKHGWTVDAVDFVELAIEEAQNRSKDYPQITYYHGSVVELDFLTPPYDFVLDVGCGHSLKTSLLQDYKDSIAQLLAPRGLFLLYGRLRDGDIDETDTERSGPRGFDMDALTKTFSDDFTLERLEQGETTVGDDTWGSAWFWWRKGES